MTTALFLVSSLIVAACGYRVTTPDFPVFKLTAAQPVAEPKAGQASAEAGG
jgi:hypothetical protein